MYKSDRSRFFGKILIFPKMGKKGPKMGKNRVFGLLRKIQPLVFARNGLEQSVLWLANFLRKLHVLENSCSQDICLKALDQSDRLISQTDISFEPFDRFL